MMNQVDVISPAMGSLHLRGGPRHQEGPMSLNDQVTHRQYSHYLANNPADHTSRARPAFIRRDDDARAFQFEFWPRAMAMGSLVGNTFYQMLGTSVEHGADPGRRSLDGTMLNHGKSYLLFDWKREVLEFRARFNLPPEQLPAVLRPVDAELPFEDIALGGILIQEEDHSSRYGVPAGQRLSVTVTVSTRRPPKFVVGYRINEETATRVRQADLSKVHRRRATAMDFAAESTAEQDAGPIKPIPEGPCAYPTFFDTYRWHFLLDAQQLAKLRGCASKFRLLAEQDPSMDVLASAGKRWHLKILDVSSEEYRRLYGTVDLAKYQFGVRTLLEGLIGHGILRPGHTDRLMAAVASHTEVPAYQEEILKRLFAEDRIRNVEAIVRSRARVPMTAQPELPPHLVMIRTVLVTPTRVLIGPKQQEPSNSVTRRYADRLDGIIRVQFADEEDQLWIREDTKFADDATPGYGLMARVRRALTHGVLVGGRRYLPVAASSSQQKQRAMWFIDHKNVDGIELRRWMGTVKETIVAKHAARMGLPFSTSRIVNLNITNGAPLPDIERPDGKGGKYCFTDGVGVAGAEVMKEAARALGFTSGINSNPSAIQFRLGGAKGVLTCWPELATEHEIRMRPSQVKFSSKLNDLNVVRPAKFQIAFLNRQFINIMSANKVPDHLFEELFAKDVTEIRGMRARVMKGHIQQSDFNLMSLCTEFPLIQAIKAGFNTNPLILDICSIIECRALQDLKWKARVKMPNGVFLIGVADESGTLRENELFCQIQETEMDEPRVVEGTVLICRAPALHPGDVRKAQCVRRPELMHLKNVIVFNVKGKRPLPNMLGGGDLDGDDFTLIWDERFVKSLRQSEPMDYTADPPLRVRRVDQSHLNENFVQYVLDDILGQVDNAHLAWSDRISPYSEVCLELSKIHSTAVDFAKTGIAALFDGDLRVRDWPDFMDENDTKRRVYESKKILGKLFRSVQTETHYKPSDIRKVDYPTDERLAKHPIYKTLIEALKPIKQEFENRMHYDMRRYRVREGEIPSGIALRNKRRKRAKDQDLNEPLRDSYNSHCAHVRNQVNRALEGIKLSTSLTPLQVVARHAYALTFEKEYVEDWEQTETNAAVEHGVIDVGDEFKPLPMLSFAWVFWEELIQIAMLDALE